MFNKVVLLGNLTRNIELRYSSNGGLAVGSTGIAVTRKFTTNGEKREETCFVDLTFFGRTAEVANQYLAKGSKVLIEGRLKLDQWTDNNGQNRSKHSVVVENMEMLGGGSGGSNQGANPNNQYGSQDNYNKNHNYGQQNSNYGQQNNYDDNRFSNQSSVDNNKKSDYMDTGLNDDDEEIPF